MHIGTVIREVEMIPAESTTEPAPIEREEELPIAAATTTEPASATRADRPSPARNTT